jgi:hypothetical protein
MSGKKRTLGPPGIREKSPKYHHFGRCFYLNSGRFLTHSDSFIPSVGHLKEMNV